MDADSGHVCIGDDGGVGSHDLAVDIRCAVRVLALSSIESVVMTDRSDLTQRCDDCQACDPRYWHHHLRELSWSDNGGTSTLPLPHCDGITIGCWVCPSPIPYTPPWEWVVTNMPVTVVPGMSAGYADTEADARQAVNRALQFWSDLGYHTDATKCEAQ